MPNPYSYGPLVTDPAMFFGREAELNTLRTRLRTMQSTAVVGQRRIGKSSLLYQLARTLRDELGSNFVPLYVSLQDARYRTVTGFVRTIAEALNERMGGILNISGVTDMSGFTEMMERLSNTGIRPILCLDEFEEFTQRSEEFLGLQAENSAVQISALTQKHLAELRRTLDTYFDVGELRTLCFDLGIDFDALPGDGKANKARELVAYLARYRRIPELVKIGKQLRPGVPWGSSPGVTQEVPVEQREFNDNFFEELRALGQHGRLVMVTASRTPLIDLVRSGGLTSPLPNIFSQIELGLLEQGAAQALRRTPFDRDEITLSHEDEALVEELGGRHPFFLQMACYHLYETLAEPPDRRAEIVRERFNHDAEPHFERLWDHLDAGEKAALKVVVGQAVPTNETERTLKRLASLGMVERADGKWQLFSAAFTTYVQKCPFQLAEPEVLKQEKSKEPSPSLQNQFLLYTGVAIVVVIIAALISSLLPAQRILSTVIIAALILPFALVGAGRLTGQDFVQLLAKLLNLRNS